MDFSTIIEAIDSLIEKRVQGANYTRMLIATIIGIENSEKNSYKVTCDGGKTTVLAADISPTDGTIKYQKNDSVYLLQLNGIGNSNVNLYILGKSEELSAEELADLEEYLTVKQTYVVTLDNDFGSDVINSIKEDHSFILSAKITLAEEKERNYHYGLKIIFTLADGSVQEYVFDSYQMTGQPWAFKGVTQSFKKTLEDSVVENLTGGRLEIVKPEGDNNITISDITISSALLSELNVYKAEFVDNTKKVNFITNATDTTIKVNFYKNDTVFSSELCKYYWFVKNASITEDSEEYNENGGVGWQLLNKYTSNFYYDPILLKDIEEKKIENSFGNILTVNSTNALQYHNYYKCVVLYGNRTFSTDTKEILNISNINVITFDLVAEPQKVGNYETELKITLNLTDSNGLVKNKKWVYKKDNGDDIKLNLSGDEIILNKTSNPTIKDFLGNTETKILCELLGEGNITLGETSAIVTNNIKEISQTVTYYYGTDETAIPDPPISESLVWVTNADEVKDFIYQWQCSREEFETYNGTFGDVLPYNSNAEQLFVFLQLTNNGEEQGLYLKDYKLYINANYIKTGTLNADLITAGALTIGEIFKADIENSTVNIGGFTVGQKSLSSGSGDTQVCLGTDKIQLGNNFIVKNDGTISAINLAVGKQLIVNSEEKIVTIGGLSVSNDTIYFTNGAYQAGMSTKSSTEPKNDIAFWAGSGNDSKAEFYVTYDGTLHCKQLTFQDNAKIDWTQYTTPLQYFLYSDSIEAPDLTEISSSDPGEWKNYDDIINKEIIYWYAYSTTGQKGSYIGPLVFQGKDGKEGAPGKDGKDGSPGMSSASFSGMKTPSEFLEAVNSLTSTIGVISINQGGISADGSELEVGLDKGNWSVISMTLSG